MNSVSLDDLVESYKNAGQEHVFRFFSGYSEDIKREFIKRAQSVDLGCIGSLVEAMRSKRGEESHLGALEPVEPWSLGKGGGEEYSNLIRTGEKALREGRVGALVVAGGQGTRLGFHGPKGILPITPVRRKSFFQIFAEKIQAAQMRYKCIIPWYVMTNESNYDETKEFFERNGRFGLKDVHFFSQGEVPVVDFDGKFLLDEKGMIAMAPDGHGGCFEALVRSGLVAKMEEQGIDIVSYFQVDNPLVRCIDPLFIGLHVSSGSEMSSKCVEKVDSGERVGLFCREGGHLKVVEYSYASQEMLTKGVVDGKLFFNVGNIAVHLLDREFIRKMGGPNGLKFHQARKVTPYLDAYHSLITPDRVNSIKFEKLIFDALVEARNTVLMEVDRKEEFSPVKNAQGEDSPESCREDQMRRCVRWLNEVGEDVPCGKRGGPLFNIEISPLFADTEEEFIVKWNALSEKPKIVEEMYLE